MKILVTGGAGFIGYHLSTHLADEGNDMVLCDNLSRGEADVDFQRLIEMQNVEFLELDMTDSSVLACLGSGYDLVYHLAAVNGTRYFYEQPHEVLRTNILSLVNVLDWMAASDVTKMVWCSSSEVYSGTARITEFPIPTPEDVQVAIDDVTNPRYSYAGSKIAGELLCINYSRFHDIDIAVIRPHNIYGPRMGFDHVIPEFIMRLLKKEDPFRIYGDDQTRSFCYIDDFIRGLVAVGGSDEVNGEIINLGDNREEIKIRHLANKLFDRADFHPEIEILPPPPGSVERRCPDITKARRLLDYNPEVDLADGLERTFKWYEKVVDI